MCCIFILVFRGVGPSEPPLLLFFTQALERVEMRDLLNIALKQLPSLVACQVCAQLGVLKLEVLKLGAW